MIGIPTVLSLASTGMRKSIANAPKIDYSPKLFWIPQRGDYQLLQFRKTSLLLAFGLLFGAQQSSALTGYSSATYTLPVGCDLWVDIDDQAGTAAVYIDNYMDGETYYAGGGNPPRK